MLRAKPMNGSAWRIFLHLQIGKSHGHVSQ